MRPPAADWRRSLAAAIIASAVLACGAAEPVQAETPLASPWQDLLDRHRTDDGTLRFRSLASEDGEAFRRLVDDLDDVSLDGLSGDDQLAFWLNAYHVALTRAVLDGEHVETDRHRAKMYGWAPTSIAGRVMSLDDVEARLGTWARLDPRVHTAVFRGVASGPPLHPEAFRGERIGAQLARAAEGFLRDRSRNPWDPRRKVLRLSKVFAWYRSDFDKAAGSLAQWAVPRAALGGVSPDDVAIRFASWRWELAIPEGESPR